MDLNRSLLHLTLMLELKSDGLFSLRHILDASKNLETHSMDDVMYGKTNLVIFDQFVNTFI